MHASTVVTGWGAPLCLLLGYRLCPLLCPPNAALQLGSRHRAHARLCLCGGALLVAVLSVFVRGSRATAALV